MFGKKFDRQQAKQPIKAKTLNDPIAEVERLSNFSFSAPIDAQRTATGTSVRLAIPEDLDARITAVGTGGRYGWRGIYADVDSPGAWLDFPPDLSGTTTTDPLFERNGNTALTVGTRVLMQRRQGQWVTTYSRCP